jgi:8-oxo-dGTP pyrophosphatase MutT (NUDIX family)
VAPDADPVTALPAAAVIPLRDGRSDLEVAMVQRSARTIFGGYFVFPGGTVDARDHDAQLARHSSRDDSDASARLGLVRGGLAYWMAAIRECFEECGLLLATDERGALTAIDSDERRARFALHRARVDSGEETLADLCQNEGLRLATERIHPFSHWITPFGEPRRFDTRFFVVDGPVAQSPKGDGRETDVTRYLRVRDAIEQGRRGELAVMFPTLRQLEALAEFVTVSDVIAYASRSRRIETVMSRKVVRDGVVVRLIPGDDGYEEANRIVATGC